jgi:hypothetical protein
MAVTDPRSKKRPLYHAGFHAKILSHPPMSFHKRPAGPRAIMNAHPHFGERYEAQFPPVQPCAARAAAAGRPARRRGPCRPAVATLDVCHDAISGSYRYSGVVALKADAGSTFSASTAVQNQTSAAGYADLLRTAPLLAGTARAGAV